MCTWVNAKVMAPSVRALHFLRVSDASEGHRLRMCAHGVYAAGGCSEEHLLLEMTIAHNSAE